jgi:hypothetical protein
VRYHVSAMADFFIQIAVALPVLLLWFVVVALIARAFGVRLPFPSLRGRKGTSQSLTFSKHMLFIGVLYWGCGMWILTTLHDYLEWKYLNGPVHDFSAGRLLFHSVVWPLGGLLFG